MKRTFKTYISDLKPKDHRNKPRQDCPWEDSTYAAGAEESSNSKTSAKSLRQENGKGAIAMEDNVDLKYARPPGKTEQEDGADEPLSEKVARVMAAMDANDPGLNVKMVYRDLPECIHKTVSQTAIQACPGTDSPNNTLLSSRGSQNEKRKRELHTKTASREEGGVEEVDWNSVPIQATCCMPAPSMDPVMKEQYEREMQWAMMHPLPDEDESESERLAGGAIDWDLRRLSKNI